jgi:hypothetical protein
MKRIVSIFISNFRRQVKKKIKCSTNVTVQ